MGWHIETASTAGLEVEVLPVHWIDEEFGYEHSEEEKDEHRLILHHAGNRAAFVLTGKPEEWEALGEEIARLGRLAK